jgi:putative hydrolase of the HAD superfamily
MILILDLDDTLYSEIEYVYSGFAAVSTYMSTQYNLDQNQLFQGMKKSFQELGRGKIFNDVLRMYGLSNPKIIRKCISVYRSHEPNISLSAPGIAFLQRFESSIKYLVTDGNKLVQAKKIKALQLGPHFAKTYVTHQYGIKYAKPSTHCFQLIANEEECSYNSMVYIGDNPNKDFVGIKPLGIKTIRVNQGAFYNVKCEPQNEADVQVESLDEVNNNLLMMMTNEKTR